jgi:hypothetical protein
MRTRARGLVVIPFVTCDPAAGEFPEGVAFDPTGRLYVRTTVAVAALPTSGYEVVGMVRMRTFGLQGPC